MAKKEVVKNSQKKESVHGVPQYPYTITPNSLRRFLELVPTKPKPPKVNGDTLKVWGLKNTNDQSILRVLKAIDLLTPGGDPTTSYTDFMKKEVGPTVLGRQIKNVYGLLFQSVTNPETASNDELKSFFNIHSGGGEDAIRYQIQTFKALASYATFGDLDPLEKPDLPNQDSGTHNGGQKNDSNNDGPIVRIDLHIHLPENKSKSDYDAIMESIATHLYGRKTE